MKLAAFIGLSADEPLPLRATIRHRRIDSRYRNFNDGNLGDCAKIDYTPSS